MPTPDVANLSLFKGIAKFMENGETEYRDLGECSAFTTSMSADVMTYQSRRHSSRVPVKTQTVGKTLDVSFTLSEAASENLAIWAMGDIEGSPGFISIGTKSEVRGALRLVGTNEVGKAYQLDLPDVSLSPDGDLSWLTDNDWSEMKIKGTANADPVSGSFGTIHPITAGVEVTVGSPAI